MDRVKVKDNLDLERDTISGAIINTNEAAYQQRLRQKRARKEQAKEMDSIKSDIAEIKAMLRKLGGN